MPLQPLTKEEQEEIRQKKLHEVRTVELAMRHPRGEIIAKLS